MLLSAGTFSKSPEHLFHLPERGTNQFQNPLWKVSQSGERGQISGGGII